MTIKAITFDFWNTLVIDAASGLRDHRLEAWSGVLEGAGFSAERERLGLAFESSWQKFQEAWKAGEQYRHVESVLDILEELGYDVPPDVHDALVATYDIPEETELRLTEGVAEALEALKSAGLRIGIICDVGMTPSTALRRFLERHDVLSFFDHWSFSDDVGFYKPDRRIFEHALAGLGAAPADAAHIGDLKRTDVAGTLAMGMTALRYTGMFDDDTDGPEAHHVVDDHRKLPGLLLG